MSTGIVTIAVTPRMAIRTAITTEVYGRRRANWTIHMTAHSEGGGVKRCHFQLYIEHIPHLATVRACLEVRRCISRAFQACIWSPFRGQAVPERPGHSPAPVYGLPQVLKQWRCLEYWPE